MKVNGKDVSIVEPISLEKFILSVDYNVNRIAVELNGRIVPKDNYANIILKNEDSLEIVTFVGGG